MPASSGR
ncbi:hypothetical protein YPPY16_1192, partial [Yersinia pestis PY-16]